jgi:intracellular septation protein A
MSDATSTNSNAGRDLPSDSLGAVVEQVGLPEVTPKAILLGSGPRFARDAFGPVLAFYVGWKTVGLVAGIAASTALSLVAWRYERRRDRPGIMARVALAIVLVQAVIGLVADSAKVYLAQPVLVNGVFGTAFVVSAFIKRPLAGVFASEMYPFPDEVRVSRTFIHVFGRVSLAWGAYLLARSAVRMITLAETSVDAFVLVNFATGVPLTAGLMSWSVWYGIRGFRRSDEWGWAFEAPPATPDLPPPAPSPELPPATAN